MADYLSYNPLKVTVLAATHKVRAFGDDTMVDAGFTNNVAEIFISTDGEGRHIDSADRSGTVIIHLAMNSPSNEVFMAFFVANEPIPITVTDKSSKNDLFFAGSCKLQAIPRMVKKKGNTVNEYTWQFTKGKIHHSGAEV